MASAICDTRYSYCDLKEMMAERGLKVDQVTIWRWVQRYAPILNQRLERERLAGGRDLRARRRKLGVPVSSRRFDRGHHRSHVVAQPGFGGCQAILAVGVAANRAKAANDQRGRPSSLRHRDFGIETVGRVGKALPLPAVPVHE